MKYVVMSDLHMHKWQYGARLTEQGYNSRLWYLYEALMQVVKFLDEQKNPVDAVFCTGDIFHTHDKLDVQVLFLTVAAFMEIAKRCPLYLLEGNHDMANASGDIHSLKAFEPIATVIDKPMKFEVKGVPVIAHPYTEDKDSLVKFLASAEEESLGLLHQGVAGANLGSSWIPDESLTPAMISPNIKKVLIGHYHMPQPLDAGRILIPGSIAQHTWGDGGEPHGFCCFQDDHCTFYKVKSPEFYITRYDTELSALGKVMSEGHFIRVEGCPYGFDADKEREKWYEAGVQSVEFVYENELGVHTPNPDTIKTGDFSIEPLLQEYEKLQMSSRRKEIGKQLREFKYQMVNV